jgi:hypothetical protein
MTDPGLGQRLIDLGWDQGVLLPPLHWSVVFHPGDPITRIARSAVQSRGAADRTPAIGSTPALPAHGVASGPIRGRDRLVVASQACDIVKSPTEEPTIIAMRAFFTDNGSILSAADGNSSRYFLLDPSRSLVVDATILTLVEKPLLTTVTPEPGAVDPSRQRRFARWLARRYNRPALPDEVVDAVVRPILENLRLLQEANDSDLGSLETVEELRLARVTGNPPYDVRLLFIIPRAGLEDGGLALARLVARMRGWFDPSTARLVAWDARHLYEVTVGDYLDTDQILLDHYTYRGLTIRGLGPPPQV